MALNQEEKRSVYHQRQRRGMQDVRFMMLLYVLGLFLYTALGYVVISSLTQAPEHVTRTYLIYSLTSFILWCVPIRMLWNFNRLGRIVFLLCAIVSFYVAKDIVVFYELPLTPTLYKYLFLLLFFGKCLTTLICVLKLSFSYMIRSIWSMDDMFDDELQDLEMPVGHTLEARIEKYEAWEIKAQKLMRKTSIQLGMCLYISILLIFILLGVVKANSSTIEESIGAIQMLLFSECLFTGMIWSVPVIGLYMKKKWSPYLIYAAVFAELLRIVISFQTMLTLFTSPTMANEARILYMVIELFRYVLLFFACRAILRSRVIKEYMHRSVKNKE